MELRRAYPAKLCWSEGGGVVGIHNMEMLKKEPRLNAVLLSGWRPYLWIALTILILYFKSLFFGLTCLDDKDLIIDNYKFISDLSNIPKAFMSRVFPRILAPYYRPLLIVTFMLDCKMSGADLLGYHVTNILIHMAVCCALFRLLLRFGFNEVASFFFSLCFAVHPALAQAVAWVPGRNDSLLALFALASFISFLNYLDKRNRRYYFIHIAFFALGLFTKETAVMVAVVCILYDKMIAKKSLLPGELRSFIFGWIAITSLWYIVREAALRGSLEATLYSLSGALLVSLPAFIQYIGKIFIPLNLSVFPTIQDTTFLYGAVAVTLLYFALRSSKGARKNFIVFGLLWFFLFLAPSFVRPSAKLVHDFQEHRMYLPLVGIAIILNEIDAIKSMTLRRNTLIGCAVVLGTLAALSFRYMDNFRDRLSYWGNAIKTSPHSWVVRLKAASIYYDEGLLDRSEQEYLSAIRLDREASQYTNAPSAAYAGLGRVYAKKNMPDMAEKQFKRAVAAYPANYPVYISLGTLYYKQGKIKAAADMWVEALKYEPEDVDALRNMAILCADEGDYKAAGFYADRLLKAGYDVPEDFLAKLKGV